MFDTMSAQLPFRRIILSQSPRRRKECKKGRCGDEEEIGEMRKKNQEPLPHISS